MSNKSDFILTPKGTTAQRPNPAQTGMIRYNTTVPQYELYNGTAWVELGEQPPQFVSVSPNTLASDATEAGSTQNLVISGGNYKSGATVSLLYSGGTVNAASVSIDSSSQITATFTTSTISSSHVTDANTYDLKIQNASGLSVTVADTVFVDSQPTWTLANSTTLRTVMAHARTGLNIPVTTATDPDGDTVTYSATSLPTGLAINSSSGIITGNLANVTADTTNTFSVIANSTGSFSGAAQKSTTRSVNIVRKFGPSNSLLFFGGGGYLSRSQTAGNRTTMTYSLWVKPSLTSSGHLLYDGNASNAESAIYFQSGKPLIEYYHGSASANKYKRAANLLRDFSAWYHLVFVIDTGNSTEAHRMRIYINSVEIENDAYNVPTQSLNMDFNENGSTVFIGARTGSTNNLHGYLADIYFVDGQALSPTSFGETLNGIWIPKVYNPGNSAQTDYGTNGFHLTFAPSTISGTTVQDVSGKGNHWTATGF